MSGQATAQQKAARLHARALEVETNASIKEIMAALKARRDIVPSVVNYMKGLGVKFGTSNESPGSTEKQSQKTPKRELQSPVAPGAPQAEDQDEDVETPSKQARRGDVRPTIPRCYTSVGMVPPHYWLHILSEIEPVALSKSALLALRPPKSKHIPKAVLMEIVEHCFGFRADDEMTNDMHKLDKLLAHCKFENARRSRLCREMRLPPQWDRDGVYTLKCSGSGNGLVVTVTHKWKGLEIEAPAAFVSVVAEPSLLFVSRNHSEVDAQLLDPKGFGRWPLFAQFRAMEDGSAKSGFVTSSAAPAGSPDPSSPRVAAPATAGVQKPQRATPAPASANEEDFKPPLAI